MSNVTSLQHEIPLLLGDANAALLNRDSVQIGTMLERLKECAGRANALGDAAWETRLRVAMEKLAAELARLSTRSRSRHESREPARGD
jgi:hypothetical protein